MALPPGARLGPYEVISALGAGGMGEVYRGRDLRLDRTVAIKVLPAHLAADPDRRQRFEREARVVSSLNHPHICTLYDIGRQDGVDFLVMELLEGETLAQRLEKGPLSRDEFLRYGIQIADALEKAHAAGIVHRDIKPGNIMVTDRRLLKVLDFGLAKLSEPPSAADGAVTRTRNAWTEEGAILGTVAYMSPEQAEGKPVDARSDIFSLGAVLYEMLTGRRPFQGDTNVSTLSAILREEPRPAGELIGGVPRELERLISRCLRKDPNRRFQHVGDVRIALEELKEESDSRPTASRFPARPSRRWPVIAAIALLLAAAIALAARWMRPEQASGPGFVLTRLTWDSGLTTDPALSPDGKLISYASDRSGEGNLDVWVQQVAGGEAIRLTRHEADEYEPSFSPDGSRIAFRSERDGGGIYLISALGGEERLIARNGRRPRFSPDGNLIAFSEGAPGNFFGADSARSYVAPATGGEPRQLHSRFGITWAPIWSPDGRSMLFAGRRVLNEQLDWWVGTLDERSVRRSGLREAAEARRLAAVNPQAWTAEGNRVLFSARLGDSTNLWEISLSPETGHTRGVPRRLTFGAGEDGLVSASATGRLAFASLNQTLNIWSLPIQATQARIAGPLQQLTRDAARAVNPRISADGMKLVFASQKSGTSDIWIKDLSTGREMALTATPANEAWPVFSGDGTRVAYIEPRGGKNRLHAVSAAGGVPEAVCDDCVNRLQDWSPDGRFVLHHDPPSRSVDVLDVSSGEMRPLLRHSQFALYQEHFSPDGRWITFLTRLGPDRTQLFIAPFRGAAAIPENDWIPVTDGSGADDKPRWSPDGKLLYFTSERDGFRCIWAQRLDPAAKTPAGPPFAAYHAHSARRSLQNVELPLLELSVARDKIVFNMAERTGNIWMAAPEGLPQ